MLPGHVLVPLRQHLKLREVTLVPVWLETIQVPSKSVSEAGDGQLHNSRMQHRVTGGQREARVKSKSIESKGLCDMDPPPQVRSKSLRCCNRDGRASTAP